MYYKVERTEESVDSSFEIARKVVSRAESLMDLVDIWVGERKQCLHFCTSVEDDGTHSFVAVILKENGKEAAYFDVPISKILELYPDLNSIKPSVRSRKSHERLPAYDDNFFKVRDYKIGAIYDEDLCERIIPREQLLRVCMSYAICNVGEVWIERFDERLWEDYDMLQSPRRNQDLCTMHLICGDRESGAGFCESLYVELGNNTDTLKATNQSQLPGI